MADINLLPNSQKTTSANVKAVNAAKKAGIVAGVIFLMILVVGLGVYGYYYLNSSITERSTKELEQQIKALEPVEQKVVLLRDRALKISKIRAFGNASNEVVALKGLFSQIPEGVEVFDAKLTDSDLNVSIKANESRQIKEFIDGVKNSGKFLKVDLISMDFSPKDRYIVEFRFISI